MKVPSRLFHFSLYHYEVAMKRIEPDWFGRIFGEVSRDVYFLRKVPKYGPLDEGPKVLYVTDWKSRISGEYIFEWKDESKLSKLGYDTGFKVLYFDTFEGAKSVIDRAFRNNNDARAPYEPSPDSLYSTGVDSHP